MSNKAMITGIHRQRYGSVFSSRPAIIGMPLSTSCSCRYYYFVSLIEPLHIYFSPTPARTYKKFIIRRHNDSSSGIISLLVMSFLQSSSSSSSSLSFVSSSSPSHQQDTAGTNNKAKTKKSQQHQHRRKVIILPIPLEISNPEEIHTVLPYFCQQEETIIAVWTLPRTNKRRVCVLIERKRY